MTANPPDTTSGEADALSALRREVDEIDAAMHDLLMRRAEVTRRIGTLKDENSTYMRPGREAVVLRRLIARHRGALPAALLVRIWREIFAAVTALQGPLAVAVHAPEGSFGYRNLARDHFGWRTPITAYRSAAQVLEAVSDGRATVGVLPLPAGDDKGAWWRTLARDGEAVPRILARLPFVEVEPPRGDSPEALVVGHAPVEPTGDDHGFLVLETRQVISRSYLREMLGRAGFEVVDIQVSEEDGGQALNLVEVAGFVADDDPRIAWLRAQDDDAPSHVWVVGGYAVPLSLEEPEPATRTGGP